MMRHLAKSSSEDVRSNPNHHATDYGLLNTLSARMFYSSIRIQETFGNLDEAVFQDATSTTVRLERPGIDFYFFVVPRTSPKRSSISVADRS